LKSRRVYQQKKGNEKRTKLVRKILKYTEKMMKKHKLYEKKKKRKRWTKNHKHYEKKNKGKKGKKNNT